MAPENENSAFEGVICDAYKHLYKLYNIRIRFRSEREQNFKTTVISGYSQELIDYLKIPPIR